MKKHKFYTRWADDKREPKRKLVSGYSKKYYDCDKGTLILNAYELSKHWCIIEKESGLMITMNKTLQEGFDKAFEIMKGQRMFNYFIDVPKKYGRVEDLEDYDE